MKFLSILFTLCLLSLPLKAYELLMFSVKTCHYCIAFMNEVEPGYHDTIYAETLPLTIVYHTDRPEWFNIAYEEGRIQKIKGTPTFIIWDEKSQEEIDRIVGYGVKEWFYEQIVHWIDNHHKEQ